MPTAPPHGVYVHAPWCRQRCPYCSFYVVVDRQPPWRAWLEGVLRDHALVADRFAGPAESLYVGGGTPALVPLDVLQELVEAIAVVPGGERTLEVDPGTVDGARLQALCELGFDRLSLGVQTFHPGHAKRLGRAHSVAQAEELLARVAALPLRTWSMDLIFALPGQALAELDADLDRILALQPPHLSLYGLTVEPGSGYDRLLQRGRLSLPDDSLWRAMYERIHARLQAGGWQRYEVSNYARPGHRSRHNQATWRGGFYAGLGPAAHGYLPPEPTAPWGRRTRAPSDLQRWLDQTWEEVERLEPRQAALDLLLSTLRHVDGLPLERLAALGFGLDPGVVGRLASAGLVRSDEHALRLLPAAMALADGLTARLAEALVPT